MSEWLTLELFEELCYHLACDLGPDEPIPGFSTRFPNRLEACLATPQYSFGGELLYATLADQASILFYSVIKNHPFLNGNKRLAFVSALVFLYLNGFWLRVGQEEVLQLCLDVARSSSSEYRRVLSQIKHVFETCLEPLPVDAPRIRLCHEDSDG